MNGMTNAPPTVPSRRPVSDPFVNRRILRNMDDTSASGAFAPYRCPWELNQARRYFARPPGRLSVSTQSQRDDGVLQRREVTFLADTGVRGVATVVSQASGRAERGVVLAHGGSDDMRQFFAAEATQLALRGAAVILPVMRLRLSEGIDAFAKDVREAILIERAALDVLVTQAGAPPDRLSFLGHSAGGAMGAILTAVEPRLARIVISSNAAGPLARADLARTLSRGRGITDDLTAAANWFDPAHFVGTHRRAHLLVQHGRADQTAPIAAGKALFDAAAPPKTWAEYDWGHDLDADPKARNDRADFLESQVSPS